MNVDYSDHNNKTKEGTQISLSDGLFYEIEYDSSPMKGVGKFVLKPQVIKPPVKDEVREIFHRMRDISRQNHPSTFNYSRFYDKHVQIDNATIFYKQALFMKNFEDDYPEQTSFSGYFPYYQMLGYEQLRTYFTWRTNVRKGVVSPTALSYVFLYLYELLNNIGVTSPEDGLKQLTSFWNAYKHHDATIDRYVLRWLKDYHIYYNLPHSFNSFVEEQNLKKHYPKVIVLQNSSNLYRAISKYDISKSAFYTDEHSQLITDCFNFVIEQVRHSFETADIHFDDILFSPTKKINTWKPFKDALFYHWYTQPNKRVVISDNEIYLCKNNTWTFSTMITSETGRQFVGYVMKQMESVLRKLLNYKFKLKVNSDMISPDLLSKLKQSKLSLEQIIETATMAFYREATKKVVTVDQSNLHRIRLEALSTQEALIIQEEVNQLDIEALCLNTQTYSVEISSPTVDRWESFRSTLSDKEFDALTVIMQGDCLKQFVDNHNIMLEVLVDAINEKAFDTIGDNILDDEQAIYDDYKEQLKEMVG